MITNLVCIILTKNVTFSKFKYFFLKSFLIFKKEIESITEEIKGYFCKRRSNLSKKKLMPDLIPILYVPIQIRIPIYNHHLHKAFLVEMTL